MGYTVAVSSHRHSPGETLKLKLATAATPSRARQAITMFEEALRHVDPGLQEDGVTIIVMNFDALIEIRGWKPPAEQAISLTAELVKNPVDAIQDHPHLADAAASLAEHIDALCPFQPTFWHGRRKIRSADEVFVHMLRAAGQTASLEVQQYRERQSQFLGETVIFSPILRVGRKNERGNLQARVILDGHPTDISVVQQLEEHIWDAAKSGRMLPLRLQGRWVKGDKHLLRLDKPEIVSIDATFTRTKGHELLDEVRASSELFADIDFKAILSNARRERED